MLVCFANYELMGLNNPAIGVVVVVVVVLLNKLVDWVLPNKIVGWGLFSTWDAANPGGF